MWKIKEAETFFAFAFGLAWCHNFIEAFGKLCRDGGFHACLQRHASISFAVDIRSQWIFRPRNFFFFFCEWLMMINILLWKCFIKFFSLFTFVLFWTTFFDGNLQNGTATDFEQAFIRPNSKRAALNEFSDRISVAFHVMGVCVCVKITYGFPLRKKNPLKYIDFVGAKRKKIEAEGRGRLRKINSRKKERKIVYEIFLIRFDSHLKRCTHI